MANPVLDALKAQITKNTSVEQSAKLLIDGIGDRLQKAVDAALANGATEEELAPVTDEIALMDTSANDLASSVAANT